VDPVPDPLLLRKSGSAGDRTRDLCICSQKLWPLDHRGGLTRRNTSAFSHCRSSGTCFIFYFILFYFFFAEMDRQRRSYYLVNKFFSLYNTWFLLLTVLQARYVGVKFAYHFTRICRDESSFRAYNYTRHAYKCVDTRWLDLNTDRYLPGYSRYPHRTSVNCSGYFTKCWSHNLP